jgi:hypothetical protein
MAATAGARDNSLPGASAALIRQFHVDDFLRQAIKMRRTLR